MLPRDGLGLGLRLTHLRALEAHDRPAVDFFEALVDNHLGSAPALRRLLERARELAPVVLHAVGMDVVGPDPLDRAYLAAIREVAVAVGAPCVSDHLCFSRSRGRATHDLLPFPRNRASLRRAVDRIRAIQDAIGCPFGVENLAAMAGATGDAAGGWEFVAEVIDRADCGLILDVNNAEVERLNGGASIDAALSVIDPRRVLYAHLAGQRPPVRGPWVDTHDAPVRDEVWDAYARAWAALGPFPTLLEWDAEIPSYARCIDEVALARAARQRPAPITPPARREGIGGSDDDDALSAWQHDLCDALLAEPPQPAGAHGLTGDDAVSAIERFAAYREQIRARWLGVLRAEWPATLAQLGASRFDEAAARHLAGHPPTAQDIAAVADDFADTLAGSSPEVGEALALDAAIRGLLRAPAEPAVPLPSPQELASSWLRRAPTAALLHLPHGAPRSLVNAPSAPLGGDWVVARGPDLVMSFTELDPILTRFVRELEEMPLGRALAALEERHPAEPSLPARVSALLASGVRAGWWRVGPPD